MQRNNHLKNNKYPFVKLIISSTLLILLIVWGQTAYSQIGQPVTSQLPSGATALIEPPLSAAQVANTTIQRQFASPTQLGENDLRLSDMGTDGIATTDALYPAVAYNSVANQYLVVWQGDDVTDGTYEVYGQLVNAATGQEIGSDFQITNAANTSAEASEQLFPDVAYNPARNEYLVVWADDADNATAVEIYGRQIAPDGTLIGSSDLRMSDMGSSDSNGAYDARHPAVAYNPAQDEYLVVWDGDDNTDFGGGPLVSGEFEVWGQRVGYDGSNLIIEVGTDIRISTMGGSDNDGNGNYDGVDPALAYNSQNNTFMVLWEGDDDASVNKFEIWGQLVQADGGLSGTNARLSLSGSTTADDFEAFNPDITYNPDTNQFLAVWEADTDTSSNEETFGQFLDATGNEIGIDDLQISDMGSFGPQDAHVPSVAYNSQEQIYLVIWSGNEISGSTDGEYEVYGQFLDEAGGDIGVHFVWSDMGPVGDDSYDVEDVALAYNSYNNDYLAVWSGDDNRNFGNGSLAEDEFEIFGQWYGQYTTFHPGRFTLTEPSDSQVITITLAQEPLASVTVTLTNTNPMECNLIGNEVTLDASNWTTGEAVTVTINDDDIADGDQTCLLVTNPLVSTDPVYNNYNPDDVIVTVADDDVASVFVTPDTFSMFEGATTFFTITLTSQPVNPVQIPLTNQNPAECTIFTNTLTLDETNWQTGYTVTVQAMDDNLVDPDSSCTIETSPTTSDDPNYDGLTPTDVVVTILNDDSSSINPNPPTLTVSEPAGTNIVAFTLGSEPYFPVTIDLLVDGACTTLTNTVTLNSSNWDTGVPVTVQAINDNFDDGPEQCTIETLPASSSDTDYNNLDGGDVLVTVLDDDTSAVLATPSTFTLGEPSGSNFFTLKLATQPYATVTVGLAAGNNQCSLAVTQTVLTALNWQVGTPITVTAVNDDLIDGTQPCPIITDLAVSNDANYNGLNPPNVTAQVLDDDTADIIVTTDPLTFTTAMSISEPDETVPFLIYLTSQPTLPVTIDLTSLDTDECTVPASITFDETNWAGVDVPVTAVDDFIVDGNQTCTIVTAPAASGDINYDGDDGEDITVTVIDTSQPAILVNPTAATVAEPNSQAIFTISLATIPTATVRVNLGSLTPTECNLVDLNGSTLLPVSLDETNWQTGVSVTIQAVDDFVVDGDQPCTIETQPASSGQPAYQSLNASDVTIIVEDDDLAGVVITPLAATTTITEGGLGDVYQIHLTSQPTSNVTINLLPDTQTNVGAGGGVATQIILTPSDWASGQIVDILAADDSLVEGVHPASIAHTVTSSDANYQGLPVASLPVTVIDNDGDLVITQTEGQTTLTEGGTSDSYTLILASEPTGDVIVTVTPDDQVSVGAGPETSITLTFGPDDWYLPQTVIVQDVDDPVAEGTHTGAINHTAQSSDIAYDGLLTATVVVTITDNDQSNIILSQSEGRTQVSEAGLTDSYTVRLLTQPTAQVEVTLSPDNQLDLGSGAETSISLTFSPANWNVPQTVNVAAVNDTVNEGPHTGFVSHTSSSNDSAYDGIFIDTLSVDIEDNDDFALTLIQTGGNTQVTEGRNSDTYQLSLAKAPTAPVIVTISPDSQLDLGAGAGTSLVITFTVEMWQTPQTVNVIAVDDSDIEGLHTGTINHSLQSADLNYNGLPADDLTVTISDNDGPGILIEETDGGTDVSEAGESDSYHLLLNTQPISDVTLTIAPDGQLDVGAGPGTAISLTFTVATWQTPQTITIMAVDDTADEGLHTGLITHTATSSDSDYNGLDIAGVTVAIEDNDAVTSGVDLKLTKTVSPSSVSEGTVNPGQQIVYTLTFINQGSDLATSVILTDIIPSQVMGLSVSSNWPLTATGALSYTWLLGDVASNQSGTIIITGTLQSDLSAGQFINTATITSDEADIDPANNTASATVTITGAAGGYTMYLPTILK